MTPRQMAKLGFSETSKTPQKRNPSIQHQCTSEYIDEIDNRLDNLIHEKLELVMSETSKQKDLSQSVARLNEETINLELHNIMEEIKRIQRKDADMGLLNKEIQFI